MIGYKFIILSLKRIHWKLKLWVVWLWNWTSTFRGQLKSKIVLLFENPYYSFLSNFYWHFSSWSVLDVRHWSLLSTLSLYLVPFSRFSTSKFSGLDLWPSEVTWGQNCFHHSKAHTWFNMYLYLTFPLYLIHFWRFLTSKFLGFDLDLRRLDVT